MLKFSPIMRESGPIPPRDSGLAAFNPLQSLSAEVYLSMDSMAPIYFF